MEKSFINGLCVVLISTRWIVRGGAIYPPLKKTHKDLCDRCKNCRGFRSRQFIDKNAISRELLPFILLLQVTLFSLNNNNADASMFSFARAKASRLLPLGERNTLFI